MTSESTDRETREVAFSFLGAWVNATIRQAKRYRHALDELIKLHDQAERLEDWSPDRYDLMNATDAVTTEAHLLVNAAHQLEKWGELVTRGWEEERPKAVELLKLLRNSTEHLDRAVLTAEEARGSNRAAWSISKLPEGRLSLEIQLDSDTPKVFDLIAVDEIERNCWNWSEVVLDYLEPDLDRIVQDQIDAYRGK